MKYNLKEYDDILARIIFERDKMMFSNYHYSDSRKRNKTELKYYKTLISMSNQSTCHKAFSIAKAAASNIKNK